MSPVKPAKSVRQYMNLADLDECWKTKIFISQIGFAATDPS